jgi:thiamine transport system ATP-binding protein
MTDLFIKDLRYRHGSVSFSYDVQFTHNRWHILCGPSGSGKTTLLRLLSGLSAPDGGSIHLGNQDISHLAPHKRRLSLMTQANALLPGMSLQDNLLLALHDDPDPVVVRRRKIHDMIEALDLDIHLLRRSANELSGGQVSRINLARALLRPCSWLLLDEPFAAVDRATRMLILSRLQGLKETRSLGIILVSHDLDDIYSVADDITVVADGRVVESRPITAAIDKPIHKATAITLRAGAIISKSGRSYFLPSRAVHLMPASVQCRHEDLESFHFSAAKAIRLGSVQRIVDLDTDSDFILPNSEPFDGSIWFNRSDLSELKSSNRD